MGEIHFHPEALIEEAMESTELNDFGRLPVRPGLTALCETYERNILDPDARRKCRAPPVRRGRSPRHLSEP